MRDRLRERRKAPVSTPEIGWTKSTFCGSNACVEVGRDGDDYLMRDSKNPGQPAQRFTQAEWIAFLDGIQAGDFLFT
jgi:hypothetical protein